MGSQAQNQGAAAAKSPHAAGSGSSTGDPGNPRGTKPAPATKDSETLRPDTGTSPDDHIDLNPQTGNDPD